MKPVELVERNKFLIGVAVLVLAGVGTIVGLFLPLHRANGESVSGLEAKAQSLSSYVQKADMPSHEDVTEAQNLTKTYQTDLEDVRAYLAKQDEPLEQPLTDQGGKPATDGSVWKLDYSLAVDNLLNKVGKDFLVVADNPVVAEQYGDEIPDAKEMATQTRYLRVQQEAIDAIAGLNKPPAGDVVPIFNGFSFLSQPERLLSSAHSTEFTPIPFEVKLSTEFTNIPLVIHALLSSKVTFELTSITISRPDQLDRGGSTRTAWKERAQATRTVRPAAAGPTLTAARPTAAPTAMPGATPGATPGAEAPSAETIAGLREAMIARAGRRAGGPGGMPPGMVPGGMPPGMIPGGIPSGRQAPGGPGQVPGASARPRPSRGTRQMQGKKMTEEVKAKLPKTLVDVTIRGYAADYESTPAKKTN